MVIVLGRYKVVSVIKICSFRYRKGFISWMISKIMILVRIKHRLGRKVLLGCCKKVQRTTLLMIFYLGKFNLIFRRRLFFLHEVLWELLIIKVINLNMLINHFIEGLSLFWLINRKNKRNKTKVYPWKKLKLKNLD